MENIYLAISIDGVSVSAMAARKTDKGQIVPIATETIKVDLQSTHNGIITPTDELCMAVSKLPNTILNKIPGTNNEIKGLYIGVMPRSLHGEPLEARKDFQGKHRITDRDIENLGSEIAKQSNNKVLKLYHNGYERDGVEILNVRNEIADTLVRKSLAVVVTPNNDVDYTSLMNKTTKLHGVIPTHIAIGKLATDEEQRMEGVLTMHIGHQSTGLTYFCNDMVMATAVVPFGFDHAIHDMTLDEVKDDAITKLLQNSNMKYNWEKEDVAVSFKNDPTHKFHIAKGIKAMMARMQEIFQMGLDRMLASLNIDQLEVPVVLTTAVVDSDDFCDSFSEQIKHECMRGNVAHKLTDDTFEKYVYIPLVSLINEAEENCIFENELIIEEPKDEDEVVIVEGENEDDKKGRKKKKIFDIFKGGKTLFDGTEDNEH